MVSRWDDGADRWEYHNAVMHWMTRDSKWVLDFCYEQNSLEKSWTISLLSLDWN